MAHLLAMFRRFGTTTVPRCGWFDGSPVRSVKFFPRFLGVTFLKGSLGFFFGVGDGLERRLQPRIRVSNRCMMLYMYAYI